MKGEYDTMRPMGATKYIAAKQIEPGVLQDSPVSEVLKKDIYVICDFVLHVECVRFENGKWVHAWGRKSRLAPGAVCRLASITGPLAASRAERADWMFTLICTVGPKAAVKAGCCAAIRAKLSGNARELPQRKPRCHSA